MSQDIVIVSAVRTPFGRYCGSLREFDYFDLGAIPMAEVTKRVGVEPGGHGEPPGDKPSVVGQCVPEIAHPEDGPPPVLGQPEFPGDLVNEVVDLVADPPGTVGAEVGKVLAEAVLHRACRHFLVRFLNAAGGRRERAVEEVAAQSRELVLDEFFAAIHLLEAALAIDLGLSTHFLDAVEHDVGQASRFRGYVRRHREIDNQQLFAVGTQHYWNRGPIPVRQAFRIDVDDFESQLEPLGPSLHAGQRLLAEGAAPAGDEGDRPVQPISPNLTIVRRRMRPATVIALRKLKNIFDPNSVMNPGKLCF